MGSLSQYNSILSSNFSVTKPIVSSGSAQHLVYSTGRRNTLSLHGTLTLLPLHDIVRLVGDFGKSILDPTQDNAETIVWNLTLGRGETGLQGEAAGVWAIVDKGNLRQVRDKRWDLVS